MQLEHAKDPRWANAEQTLLDVTIKWEGIEEELPFTASATDTEAHGRDIFAAASAGQFGPIADFVPTPEAPALPPPTTVTPLQFVERFTDAEQLSIVGATLQNAQVKLWYDKLLAASFVDLADPRLSAGLDSLVAFGLITPERKVEVMSETLPVSVL
jgi:hypothetical protein